MKKKKVRKIKYNSCGKKGCRLKFLPVFKLKVAA